MGEARNRGTYEQRKAVAIKIRQDEWCRRGVEERDRMMAMTPEEKAERRKVKHTIMAMSQWLNVGMHNS